MPSEFNKASLNKEETGTSLTTLYTAPAGRVAVGVGFTIANVVEQDIKVTVKVGGTTLVPNAPLRVGETMILTAQGQKVVLKEQESVEVQCSMAGGIEAYLSVMEQF